MRRWTIPLIIGSLFWLWLPSSLPSSFSLPGITKAQAYVAAHRRAWRRAVRLQPYGLYHGHYVPYRHTITATEWHAHGHVRYTHPRLGVLHVATRPIAVRHYGWHYGPNPGPVTPYYYPPFSYGYGWHGGWGRW